MLLLYWQAYLLLCQLIHLPGRRHLDMHSTSEGMLPTLVLCRYVHYHHMTLCETCCWRVLEMWCPRDTVTVLDYAIIPLLLFEAVSVHTHSMCNAFCDVFDAMFHIEAPP